MAVTFLTVADSLGDVDDEVDTELEGVLRGENEYEVEDVGVDEKRELADVDDVTLSTADDDLSMVAVADVAADREILPESDGDALDELVPSSVFENDGEPEEDGQTVAEALNRRLLEIEVEAEIERVSRAEREADVLPRGERDMVAADEIDDEPEADLEVATEADSVALRTTDDDTTEEGETAGEEESIDFVDVKVELGDRVKSGDTV